MGTDFRMTYETPDGPGEKIFTVDDDEKDPVDRFREKTVSGKSEDPQ
jgi:hypothetical protein